MITSHKKTQPISKKKTPKIPPAGQGKSHTKNGRPLQPLCSPQRADTPYAARSHTSTKGTPLSQHSHTPYPPHPPRPSQDRTRCLSQLLAASRTTPLASPPPPPSPPPPAMHFRFNIPEKGGEFTTSRVQAGRVSSVTCGKAKKYKHPKLWHTKQPSVSPCGRASRTPQLLFTQQCSA